MVRINRDDMRYMLTGKYWGLEQWQENMVTSICHTAARDALKRGEDCIIDATNLRPKYVREYRKIAEAAGAEFHIHDVYAPLEVCIENDKKRDRQVGEQVIRDMFTRFMPNGKFLPISNGVTNSSEWDIVMPDPSLTPTVLVDIDGTLADRGGRDPHDLTRVHEDTPIESIVRLTKDLHSAWYEIVFMSGRSEGSRDATEGWLRKHFPDIKNIELYMRASGDNRRDNIVKYELFNEHIRGKYDVQFVLDDRNQVVEMWRAIGLTCLQVADGDF